MSSEHDSIKRFIELAHSKGHPPDRIKEFVRLKGYSEHLVEEVIAQTSMAGSFALTHPIVIVSIMIVAAIGAGMAIIGFSSPPIPEPIIEPVTDQPTLVERNETETPPEPQPSPEPEPEPEIEVETETPPDDDSADQPPPFFGGGGGGGGSSPSQPPPEEEPEPSEPDEEEPSYQFTYEYDESDFLNPERGFYRQVTLNPGAGFGWVRENYTIAHAVIRLDDYRTEPISSSFLDDLEDNLEAFRTAGLKVILRAAYNFDSSGDDANISTVLSHIDQLEPLFKDHRDVILAHEAGFIGAWGEWHTSTNDLTTSTNKNLIIDALLESTSEERMIQLRYPPDIIDRYPESLTSEYAFTATDQARIGHHNDCFVSGPLDVGTYWSEDYTIEEMQDYLEAIGPYTVTGGETCAAGSEPRADCETTLEEMERFGWNHINDQYYAGIIDGWKSEGCFEEISKRLGYRYHLHGANASIHGEPENITIAFTIENTGFGSLYNERPLVLVLENENNTMEIAISEDARTTLPLPGATTTITHEATVPYTSGGDYRLFIALPDGDESISSDPRYAVRFANTDMWNETSGRNDLNITLTLIGTEPEPVENATMRFGTTITQEDWFIPYENGSQAINIHIYGWGSLWPFEGDGIEGEYDGGVIFSDRVNRTLEDDQEVVLTACCVPSELSTGGPWQLDDSRVLDGSEETYASRIVDVLERHPEIRKVIVWNEFKGYWNSDLQRWDYEGYLVLYNAVYSAVKAFDPDIMVGGGYVVFSRKGHGYDTDYGGFIIDSRDMDAILEWAQGADGFDAVVLDGWLYEGEFAAVHTWAIDEFEVPVWWAEFYGRNMSMSQAANEIASVGRAEDYAFFWAEDQFGPFIVPDPTRTETQIILGPRAVESGNVSDATHFASPDGSGSACTEEEPCTIQTALSGAGPGRHIFLRAGTYTLTNQLSISASGTEEDPIIIESYPEERAVIDGAYNADTRIAIWNDHLIIRNINITRMAGNAGLYIQGNHNLIEGVNSYANHFSGIAIFSPYSEYPYGASGSYNTIRDCIVHSNSDVDLPSQGDHADGISISSGDGNRVLHCLAYNNSDDGIDSWRATNTLIAFSISHSNGLGPQGDGNGIKAGGIAPSNNTVVLHTLSYNNLARGFDQNGGANVTFLYTTSYDNGRSFWTGDDTYTEHSIAAGGGSELSFGSGVMVNNSWQQIEDVAFVSSDPESEDFLKPLPGTVFETMGAYARSPHENATSLSEILI